jgi:hypothetical protein
VPAGASYSAFRPASRVLRRPPPAAREPSPAVTLCAVRRARAGEISAAMCGGPCGTESSAVRAYPDDLGAHPVSLSAQSWLIGCAASLVVAGQALRTVSSPTSIQRPWSWLRVPARKVIPGAARCPGTSASGRPGHGRGCRCERRRADGSCHRGLRHRRVDGDLTAGDGHGPGHPAQAEQVPGPEGERRAGWVKPVPARHGHAGAGVPCRGACASHDYLLTDFKKEWCRRWRSSFRDRWEMRCARG